MKGKTGCSMIILGGGKGLPQGEIREMLWNGLPSSKRPPISRGKEMTAYPFAQKHESVQELIDSGKLFPASQLPEHTPAPQVRHHCHQCEQETGTVYKPTKAGIGNACDRCGAFRKGKPYVSKSEFNALTPDGAEGGHNGKVRV